MTLTIYDAAMAVLVIGGMVFGAWRGIVWQLASMGSLILGYAVSQPMSKQLAPQFPGDEVVSRALAMLVIYAVVSGGVFFAAWALRATLRQLKFEAYDRHLGMLLGGVEGAMLGLIATLFILSFSKESRGPIQGSPTGHLVGQILTQVEPILPSSAARIIDPIWAGRGSDATSGAGNEEVAAAAVDVEKKVEAAARGLLGGDGGDGGTAQRR